MIKDRELRDDPVAGPDDHPREQALGLRRVHSMNRPEGHDILRSWRTLADARPSPHPIFVGETFVYDMEQLVSFYGDGDDELHLAFNIPFALAELGAAPLRGIVEAIEERLPEAAWPVYMGSNHDIGRFATRWAAGDAAKARAALVMLLTLRGTPFLYQGDEIALEDGFVPEDRVLDVHDRDPCRTPMPWTYGPGGGFTAQGAQPWLPMTDPGQNNVASQRGDAGSTLNLARDLIALRRAEADLRSGAYETLPAPEGAWAWRRGERFAVAVNLSDSPVAVEGLSGGIAIATDRRREGEAIDGPLTVEQWSAVVVRLS
jgi:alpha-glucosidase